MTFCLSVDRVLAIHAEACHNGGIRDHAALEAALARPMQSAFGHDAFPTVVEKAAVLLHGLTRNHPFIDGNKRTAWLCCLTFLEDHGIVISLMPTSDVVEFVVEVAVGTRTVQDVALDLLDWVE